MTKQHLHPQPQLKQFGPTPGQTDDLVRLYQQALAFDEQASAPLNPGVRAAVLAAAAQSAAVSAFNAANAQADASHADLVAQREKGAMHGGERRAAADVSAAVKLSASQRADAANDARWKIRANHVLGSLAVLGLVGLLASRFLPHTAGYAELAQTLPPAPYQQQARQPAARQPDASLEQAPPVAAAEAHVDVAQTDEAVGAPAPAPMPRAKQVAKAAADATPASDAPQAAAAAPQAPVAKGQAPLPQQHQHMQPQAQPHEPVKPLAAPHSPSTLPALRSSTQPNRAEQAAAEAVPPARGTAGRVAAHQAAGDSTFDQAPTRQAEGQAVGQGASPFPLDDARPEALPRHAPLAAKKRVRSTVPQASAAPEVAPHWREAPALAAAPAQKQEDVQPPLSQAQAPNLGKPEAMQAAAPHAPAHAQRKALRQGQPAPSALADGASAADAATLLAAASRGDVAGVQLALQAGVAVDARDATGRTALMRAAAQGHVAVVRVLLQHGANAHMTDAAGRTATDYARLGRNERVVQLLAGKP